MSRRMSRSRRCGSSVNATASARRSCCTTSSRRDRARRMCCAADAASRRRRTSTCAGTAARRSSAGYFSGDSSSSARARSTPAISSAPAGASRHRCRCRCARAGAAPCTRRAAPQQKRERPEPQEQRRRLDRRLVQHEVAIARDQVLLDLGVALALKRQLAHFAAQVFGQRRRRIGQRLVLADEAAQFLLEVLEARVERGVGVRGGTRGGEQQCRHQPCRRLKRLTTSATRAPAAGSSAGDFPA